MKNIKKFIKKIYVYLLIFFLEHKYENQRYIYKNEKKSNILLVILSGFPQHSSPGIYNYVWSLRMLHVNKLWIRDRFGYYGAGTYYLGENCSKEHFTNKEEIIHLVNKYRGNKSLIFAGSSKGGTSALYYGIELGAQKIIIGSPQYYLGNYLSENDYHKEIMHHIFSQEDAVEILNSLIPNQILTGRSTNVAVLYSSKEKAYHTHIKPLLCDLKRGGIMCMKKMLVISSIQT